VKRTRSFITAVLLVCIASVAVGQVELVPADHDVYDFLKRMQVRGMLTGHYYSASLPQDRRTVAKLLAGIDASTERLSRSELGFLENYREEFSYELGMPRERRVSLLNEGISSYTDDRQKYLYRYESETAVISANLLLDAEPQQWEYDARDPEMTTLWRLGGGLSGTLGGWFGFSLHAVNGYASGSREAALQNIEVSRTYKIGEPDSRFFDYTRGHVRAANEWGSLTIGRERPVEGNGVRDRALLFSDHAPAIDYFGIDIAYKKFFFRFFHGWILGDGILRNEPEIGWVRDIPDKYVSFHRFGAHLLQGRLSVAFSEIIVYGDRSPEIAYMTPFLFFKSVEHSLQDRDKAMLAVDVQARPVPGIELYGDLLIDDLAFEKLGTNWYGNQYAFRIGTVVAPGIAGLKNSLISFDYSRIQPYVYTHRIPGNAYTHNGFAMGNPVGPNSDTWSVRWQELISGMLRTEIYMERSRKGHNLTDPLEGLLRNVGGDVRQGYRIGDSTEVSFLDGFLERTISVGVLFEYEVITQIFLEGGYEFQKREQEWLGQTFREHFMFGRIRIEL
jgi:hypothetical protein